MGRRGESEETQVRVELALIEVSMLSISLIAQSLVDNDEVAEWPAPPAWERLLAPWPAYGAKLKDQKRYWGNCFKELVVDRESSVWTKSEPVS